ncbi:MAG TPA: hypothetical protein VI792_04605, partial [Candidatus Eisenbacteria bacterium]
RDPGGFREHDELAHGPTMPSRATDCKNVTMRGAPGLDGARRRPHHFPLMSRASRMPTVMRRIAGLLGPLLGVVLVSSLVAVALHHHDDGAVGHSCAICSVGHAPATPAAAAVSASTPRLLPGRVEAARAEAPLAPRTRATASRAPPLA